MKRHWQKHRKTQQRNTAIADGVSGLNDALAALVEAGIEMIYDETHLILAQGNYVLAVSEGTYGGKPTSYYDLWRIENGKIAEHWDVMETIADETTWANENGKLQKAFSYILVTMPQYCAYLTQ